MTAIRITSNNPVNELQETLDGLLRYVRVRQLSHNKEVEEKIYAYNLIIEAAEAWLISNSGSTYVMEVLQFRTNVIGAHATCQQIMQFLKSGLPSHGQAIENNTIHQKNENKLKQ